MPKISRLKVVPVLFSVLVLGACSALQNNELATQESIILNDSVAETVDAFVDFQAATKTSIQLSASPTASHTPTVTATVTPSPTPVGSIAILLVDAICRSGPGIAYPSVENLEKGWVLSIDKISANQDYFVILLPSDNGKCWLSYEFANFDGESSKLAIATAPSTPTPNVVWRGEWSIWVGPAPLTQYFMTIEHAGTDISGSFDSGSGNTVSFNGSLDENYLIVRGIWSSSLGGSGTFIWEHKNNPNQFIGNIDGGPDEWCGARAGASLPSPCLGP